MQLHQIVIRPQEQKSFVLYVDAVGNRGSLFIDSKDLPAVAQVIAACEAKLPPDTENPNKQRIQEEMAMLEKRLTDLRRAVGQA